MIQVQAFQTEPKDTVVNSCKPVDPTQTRCTQVPPTQPSPIDMPDETMIETETQPSEIEILKLQKQLGKALLEKAEAEAEMNAEARVQ